jgi:hypothetical protein
MVSVIIFSKDRPLQLEGYLTSLMFYSGIREENIHILYTSIPGISYEILVEKYKRINWINESSYSADLNRLIRASENYIMFGCDDVFFIETMNINHAFEALEQDKSIFSFHLRLGLNIENRPQLEQHPKYLKWNWTQTNSMHWNYPWEVSAAIYRKSDVLSIIDRIDFSLMKSPNYFEDLIVKGVREREIAIQPNLASFYKGKALTLTVNRVQEDYKNPFDQTDSTSVEDLYNEYLANKFLDWRKFENSLNTYIHVNSSYFSLTNEDPANYKRPTAILAEHEQEANLKLLEMGFCLKWIIFRNRLTRRLIRLVNLISPSLLLEIRRIRKKIREIR